MNEQHGQKCDSVGMDRRDFLGAVARTVPTWLMVTAIVPELLASETESPEGKYKPEEHRYAMAINIHKCIGCGRCADACKTENNVPREPVFFRTWIERYRVPFEGEAVVDSPNGGINGFPTEDHDSGTFKAFFVPKLCNHCSNAPCVQVCPVGATFTSQDGVVLVDKDRVKSGRYAIEKFGCDTLLLDDGFQYWKLRGRRRDIVLIDCQQPFGNEHLLPRGTLREPPSHLNRASTIFITKSNGNTDELRKRIQQYNPHASIIECVHHPLYFEDVFTGERQGLDFLKNKKLACLSGIAQPESFEQSLIEGNHLATKALAGLR